MSAGGQSAPKNARRPAAVLWGAVALALVFGAAFWALLQEPAPLQLCRRADGTRLRLEAVTMGPQHRIVLGRYWQRLLATFASPGTRSLFGATFCAYGPTPPSTAVFWLTWQTHVSLMQCRAVAFNDSGEEVEVITQPFRSPLGSGDEVWAWVVHAFPRRGARLGLRLYVNNEPQPIAEFHVRNPSPGPHPTWTAPLPPVTTTDRDQAFTLTRLETGRVAPSAAPSFYRDRHWTHAVFRERGRPSDRWEPVGITLSDATGNRITPWERTRSLERGEAHLRFRGNLPLHEAAWKLRVEFAPVRRLTPSEQWQVRGVPLPHRGADSRIKAASRKHGVWLVLNVRRPASADGTGRKPIGVMVDALAPAFPPGLRLALIRVVDDRSRESPVNQGASPAFLPAVQEFENGRLEVARPNGSETQYPGGGMQGSSYPVQIASDAQTLDLTFAVVRSRFVEFLARPVERPNGPGS